MTDAIPAGPPEIVDNKSRYGHADALRWLGEHRSASAAVATGYVRLGGLVALAQLPGPGDRAIRILLGAVPDPGLGALPVGAKEPRLAGDAFQETLQRLRLERDFDAFPESRRTATLDLVESFVKSDRVQVRRYTDRFLHGKTYIFADRMTDHLDGEGAVLITSANLTSGGLIHNLELGGVSYQPSMVELALDWFEELWAESAEFKDDLLALLYPPLEQYDPQTIFRRALLELYGDEIEAESEERPAPGGITLTRFQEDGYRRARRILEEFGGVIYADGVGTGKTSIGLRFIEEYARERGLYTLVISPAQLRESLWQKRLQQELLPGQVISYQELASDQQLGGTQRRLLLDKDAYRLVVIDEAHAFRNADNTWYAALDHLLGGKPKHLVMLTATPVNNALWDLYNLVMLFSRHDAAFRGSRLAVPSLRELFVRAGAHDPNDIREEVLFPLVDAVAVRRDRRFIEQQYAGETFEDGTPVRFPAPLLEEVRYDLDAVYPGVFGEVVDTIGALTMARYVPSRYQFGGEKGKAQEEALAGLMQSQLLKRFESSAAAARQTLGRMILAHQTLVTAWNDRGQVPSIGTLKDIVKEAQEGEPLPDLVAAALDDDEGAFLASEFDPKFLEDVEADLGRLTSLATTLDRLLAAPDPKLETLARVLMGTTAAKVAVFCSYADTAHYVAQAIEADPTRFGGRSLAVVVGTESDADERTAKLERFCPSSVTGDPDFVPSDGEVDLLVSTDVLSEGQNLQQAQAVVSYDLPWNPQRVVQRNGRVIRLASPHDHVFIFTILPKHGDLEEALRLEARVRGKIAAANATFGMESQVLADLDALERTYTDEVQHDLEEYFRRVEEGDETLLDEGQAPGSGSFAGELYRLVLSRLFQQGEFKSLRKLPWGIGSAFVKPDLPAEQAGVFFACRTSSDERAWRFVTFNDDVVREDLEMLRLIDSEDEPRADLPTGDALERAWNIAAADICRTYNSRLDPKARAAELPASQRWALEVLRNPDIPDERVYNEADEALGVGRNQLVRRELSAIRRRAAEEGLGVREAADAVVDVVRSFGLRPEPPPAEPPAPIGPDDLGVVVFQAVLVG